MRAPTRSAHSARPEAAGAFAREPRTGLGAVRRWGYAEGLMMRQLLLRCRSEV